MRGLRGTGGQMSVELAVVAPVVIVLALIVWNLMCFVEACAAFDQAALDAVTAHGVAPSGEQSERRAVEEVRAALEDTLSGLASCEVDVRSEPAEEAAEGAATGAVLTVSPLLTRYVCTLTYHPRPRLVSFPGVPYGAPLALVHERELVVDRYRSGVVT